MAKTAKPITVTEDTIQLNFSAKGNKKDDSNVQIVAIKDVKVMPDWNPRGKVSATDPEIQNLQGTIQRAGLINPPTVRPAKKEPGKFELIAGERRLLACKALGYTQIPVVVREDAAAEEVAHAIAVAENGEGRVNLNDVQLARRLKFMSDKFGMSVSVLAATTGYHAQKVRRCLELLEAPKEVQEKVEEGKWGTMTALEVAKLDPKTRKQIKDELTDDLTKDKVKALAKKAANKETTATPGKDAKKQTGAARDAALTAWKGAKVKQEYLQHLCYSYVAADADFKEKGQDATTEFYELRGAIAWAMWDRGDIDDPSLPPHDLNEISDAKERAAAEKKMKKINAVIAAEAKKYSPPEDESGEAEEAEAEAEAVA